MQETMKPAVDKEETSKRTRTRKRVSFASTSAAAPSQNENANDGNDHHGDARDCGNCSCHYYYYHDDAITDDERKSLCWYSPEDLLPCRQEAKDAIQQLQTSLENGTLDSLPDHICFRGIEKYADAATRYRKQRMFVGSILLHQQQAAKNDGARLSTSDDLANLARYLSKPSIEQALFYAGRCAAELALMRHEEEDEEDGEDEWEDGEEDFSCSSQMDVRESKLDGDEKQQVCVDQTRKRSRFLALGDMNSLPPRKIQCCE